MNLQDYDKNVKPHLHAIEAGALMAARHARLIPLRPGFESYAEEQLAETRKFLQNALALIICAQQTYRSKPIESGEL